ncbi:MAG: hypothetical protein ACREMM_08760, partial [Gemmatimonadales bacterium]
SVLLPVLKQPRLSRLNALNTSTVTPSVVRPMLGEVLAEPEIDGPVGEGAGHREAPALVAGPAKPPRAADVLTEFAPPA